MTDTLRLDIEGRVFIMTFNRSEAGNAINQALGEAMGAALDRFNADDDLDVAILTATGDRFCMGADMVEMAEHFAARKRGDTTSTVSVPGLVTMGNSFKANTKPIIGAVNGRTAGVGLSILADCDILICSENAAFTDPHVSWGGLSASMLLPFFGRLPMDAIMRLGLLGKGEWLTADRAHTLGLVGEVTTREGLLPRALELANQMVAANQPALRVQRAALRAGLEVMMRPMWVAARAVLDEFKERTAEANITQGTEAFMANKGKTGPQP